MDHFWIAVFTSLTLVAWVSSSQVVLESKPCDSSGQCTWNWILETKTGPGIVGWTRRSGAAIRYTVCDVDLHPSAPQPSSWLLSDQLIIANDTNRIDITVEYLIRSCSHLPPNNSGGAYCVNFFYLYVNQSDHYILDKALYPNPLLNTAAYENVARIGRLINVKTLETIKILNKGKYLLLAFHNDGACNSLYSVKVTYYVCPGGPLVNDNSLVSLARTVAPANDSQSIRVEGSCGKDTVHVAGSLYVHCQSNGEWNTSGLKGKCICKEDMQNVGGKCQACPDGKYNDQNGLNCTVLPSAPRNINFTFINQSSVEISWLPPAITVIRRNCSMTSIVASLVTIMKIISVLMTLAGVMSITYHIRKV
ncbi:hypothetical protein OS493_014147 [Desmophyllum pertusum]|uniref:Eph LBD domain-containing protein n=1 Tax=Desmophyllum pertusum TaxID=174260 RepID=A0A9X0CY14_9CNID|nr:hypothetical protein OS493_014147 [Desmophyllum pertusum]